MIKSSDDLIKFFEKKGFPTNGNIIQLNDFNEQVISKSTNIINSEKIKEIRKELRSKTYEYLYAVCWEEETQNFAIVRRIYTPIETIIKKDALPPFIYSEICKFFNNFKFNSFEYTNPFEVLYMPRYRQKNTDKRVNLAFLHFPKNAYESKAFFRLISHFCMNNNTISNISSNLSLLKQITYDIPISFIPRASSKTKRGSKEEIRDSLDFANYIGLVSKTREVSESGGTFNYSYKITNKGEIICDGNFIDNNYESLENISQKEKERRRLLTESIVNYGIFNCEQDLTNYSEYMYMKARPFYIMLWILNELEKKGYNISIHQYLLGFYILTTLQETPENLRNALIGVERLLEIPNKKQRIKEINKILQKKYIIWNNKTKDYIPLTYNKYKKRVNNFTRRMFGWAFTIGLIDLETQGWKKSNNVESIDKIPNNLSDPIEIISRGYKITSIVGITEKGKEYLSKLNETTYIPVTSKSAEEISLYRKINENFGKTIKIQDLPMQLTEEDTIYQDLVDKNVIEKCSSIKIQINKRIVYFSGQTWDEL
ncbi:MAG: hypothetical protein K9W44_10240 [Candidatus Lokiarchaeota archaeon]|nr:hypothetical protein [Candidatus Harpocratesius repetitus]